MVGTILEYLRKCELGDARAGHENTEKREGERQ